ncbi:hypothetical protein [Vibrio paucivorans]
MKTQQLRQLVEQSCCGTLLDKSTALALINEIEATLETREQLLVETLHILESSNKAVRMGAVNSSVIENQSAAIRAIRNHFECKSIEGLKHDTIQADHSNLQQTKAQRLVPSPAQGEVDDHYQRLSHVMVNQAYKGRKVWDAKQSIKSIERRIKAAINHRDFRRAGRLNAVQEALELINYDLEVARDTF